MKHKHRNNVATISEKQYVLGRREKTIGGALTIGRYYALDGSLGAEVHIDVLHPHIILICGKRGYGKSYTIGVLLEEIGRLEEKIKQNLGVVVLDTLGIYWTTQYQSNESSETLNRWGCKKQEFKIQLFVPKNLAEEYRQRGIHTHQFSLKISEISTYHWCHLFNIKPTDALGVFITKTVLSLQSISERYSFSDILTGISNNSQCDEIVKNAAENYFTMAESWGVFDENGLSVTDLVERGTLNIIDISGLTNPVLEDIVASLIGRKIFDERVQARKIHEQKKMGFDVVERGIPMVWFAVDEAQVFIPNNKETLSKEVFIDEWMRQGRQPGLSLIMATQRPSALEPEVFSHSDLIICHRLTAQEDIDMLQRIRPTYMHGNFGESLRKIGDEKGVALLVDDTSEVVHIIKIRPRLSWHGGAEPLAGQSQGCSK